MLQSDPNQERPTAEAVSAMWNELSFEPRTFPGPVAQGPLDALRKAFFKPSTLEDPAAKELLDAFRKIYPNGGAIFASFNFMPHQALHWFVSRYRLNDIEFPERFLKSPAVVAALPELCKAPVPTPFDFVWEDPFTFAGEIARMLTQGGAYDKYKGGTRGRVRYCREIPCVPIW